MGCDKIESTAGNDAPLTREELFALVWERPATEIARELGISDEYKTDKRPFPRSHRVSWGDQIVVNRRCDAVLAEISPRGQQKCGTSARFFDDFHARHDSGPAAASVSQPLDLLAWLRVYQTNKRA